MYSDPPSDRIEEGRMTAYGHEIEYAIDLLHYSNRTIRRVAAWVHHDSGEKFVCQKYGMTPSLFDRLLGRERPVPEDAHREEVLDEAQAFAKKLAKRRAEAMGEEFEPGIIVGVTTRRS